MSSIKFTIPEPCHENWQNMTVVEQGRFCSACQKEVIDFSHLSNREAYNILIKSNTNACGRFSEAQMGKGINYSTEKRKYWHRYFFSFLVPAVLFTKQSAAQGKIVSKVNTRNHWGMEKMVLPFREKSFELSGSVTDSLSKEKIDFATVIIKNTGTGMAVDEQGNFKLKGRVKDASVIVRITAIGYEPKEMEIAVPNDFIMAKEIFYLKKQVIDLEAVTMHSSANYLQGVAGGISIRVKSTRWNNLQLRIVTAVTDSLRIFPNPVKQGNDFKVSLKLRQTGNHTLQVIAMDGRVVFQKPFIAADKTYAEEINCSKTWAAGTYNLRVIGPGNRTVSAARFVVN